MKNSKNKILAAAVCGVIVSSIGASFIIDNNKNELKADIPQDIENSEIDKTEVNAEGIEINEENIENEIDNTTEENMASAEELTLDSYSSEVNSSSSISDSNENSQNTTSNNTTNNIQSNDAVVEEVKDEVSNGGANSNINDMEESTSKYKDGTYSGSASGFAGVLQVNVQISNDVITSITITSHNDTPGFVDRAIEEIPSKIIASQSISVDVISGATYTSKGIMNAVNDALSKA
ncbi:FMN-binding protein [Clostridioides difficile]